MSDHNIIHVTDETFETEVLESTEPVLVDFWAEWCGPCRAIAPILEEIAAEYDGQLKVAKVNVDENAQSSVEYAIRGIPTLMLFKNGRLVERLVGAVSKKELLSRIRNHLGGNGVKDNFYQKFMGG